MDTSSPRRARPCSGLATAMLAVLALGGCGAAANDISAGYPPASPRVRSVAFLQPTLAGSHVRVALPAGWSASQLDGNPAGRKSLVLMAGACYLTISITGAAQRSLTPAQIRALYAQTSDGYAWTLSGDGGTHVVALLAQYDPNAQTPSRSTLGTAYLRLSPGRYLAVDFGAGVWPLRRADCTEASLPTLIAQLRQAIVSVFSTIRTVAAEPAAVIDEPHRGRVLSGSSGPERSA